MPPCICRHITMVTLSWSSHLVISMPICFFCLALISQLIQQSLYHLCLSGTFPTHSKIPFSDDDFAAYIESKAAAAAAKATNTKNQHTKTGHIETGHTGTIETVYTGTIETAFECGVCTTYFRSNDTLVDHMKIHKKHLTAPLIKSYKSTEKVLNTKPDDEECLIMKEHKRDDSENSLDIKIVSCKSMAEVDRCDTPLGCLENSDSETSNVLNGIDHQAKDKYKNDEVTITARKEFKCEICYKCFTAKQSLKYHMFHIHKISEQHNSGSEFSSECESDTKMKPYECKICHKRFKYKNVLPLHMKTRHNTLTNKSDKKGANAKYSQSEINEHNKSQVSENFSLTLSNCDVPVSVKNTGNPSNIKTSKKNIQKTPIGLNTTCEVCKKTLSSKQSLKYHMRVHTGEKPYECSVCLHRFAYKHILINHLRIHTGEKPYECTVCSSKFARKKSLIAHSLKCDIVKHKGDKSPKNYLREPDNSACQIATGENAITFEPKSERSQELYCDRCHEEFQSSDMLLKHISMQHSEHNIKSQSHKHNLHHFEPLFLNKIPETARTSKNRRKRKPVSHTCEICKKVCSTKLSFTYHMRRHTGEKPFTCNICQKHFYTKQNMRYHMDFNHGPSSVNMSNSNKHTSYKCDVCGKYLSSSTSLKIHYRRHTGEKPFKCSICAYSSITKTLLDNHLQTHNREGKRFPCEVCSKLFYTKENMQSHLVIHSGEKPYSCTICHMKFAHKSSVWYHRRKHHPYE
ncbi:unnamed protein product [Owenia fusiformis]|uniref:C2H2-type domain-containing protein n=1 Tax=Owenia fusiformis TaxID=6347 RepID=A0A8S4N906_OWEFU|nr:unnamed protein product [Owenia fusiformis]